MCLIYNIEGTNGPITLDLTEDASRNIDDAQAAMVIPMYHNSYVMTYHPKRAGWEFPKGKRHENEDIRRCAIRETFEETGAILEVVKPIGYFIVTGDDFVHKTAVFTSQVERFEPKPRWSETDLVKLFDKLPKDVSFKDDVYKIILHHLKGSNLGQGEV